MFAGLGHRSVANKDCLKGRRTTFVRLNETDVFSVGGPCGRLSAGEEPRAHSSVKAQKLRDTCGFLNLPEVIRRL